jgi:cobalt-zinc-cadmium efflux system outer membrane protein
MQRVDAERTLELQVKQAYVLVAQAKRAEKFARDVAESQVTTLKKFRARAQIRGGAISEGDLERVEVQKLEADQAVDTAAQAVRQARVALAFLLGVRGVVPDFEVDIKVLDYTVPARLAGATEATLLRQAFEKRPDLAALGYQHQQAREQLRLVRRQRFPDIALGLGYSFGGFGGYSTNGPIQGQTLSVSLSLPLPVFYHLQGEQRQAHAQLELASLQEAKQTAQVASDIANGLAAFATSKRLVERMEGPRRDGGGLLESAHGAFIHTEQLYDKGNASLTDYLDALRQYIATKNEYFGDLASYWTAVFEIEAALGGSLR